MDEAEWRDWVSATLTVILGRLDSLEAAVRDAAGSLDTAQMDLDLIRNEVIPPPPG